MGIFSIFKKSLNKKPIAAGNSILNLGSGNDPGHAGIINVDVRPLENVDLVCDVKKLPFKDNEVKAIKSRNLIEHFGRHEVTQLVNEWARVLKPGGILKIETVDMGELMNNWKKIPAENLLDGIYGAQDYPENFHKMGFTRKNLEDFFRAAGLRVIKVEQFIAREIPRIIIQGKKTSERDYIRDWISPEGKEYRNRAYNRQKKGGENPLVSNPTFDEIKKVLNKYQPNSVLEVGCGWGRILEELCEEYKIEGCDVSKEYLKKCDPKLKVFYYDIAVPDKEYVEKNKDRWDVLFCRGLMLYFMEVPEQMETALKNMAALAKKKVIFWEWPEVCERIKNTMKNDKFEFHIIEHRDE